MDLFDRLRLAREASNVERCHQVPHLAGYSVGKHSGDLAMLLILCWREDHGGELPSNRLLAWALTHDAHERVTGDIPSPTKALLGNDRLDAVERAVTTELLGVAEPDLLTEEERAYAHLGDKLECWLWVEEERARGNRALDGWAQYYAGWFGEPRRGLPSSVLKVVSALGRLGRADISLPRLTGVEEMFLGAERV